MGQAEGVLCRGAVVVVNLGSVDFFFELQVCLNGHPVVRVIGADGPVLEEHPAALST